MSELVYYEIENSNARIASLYLNRPEKMNAFSGDMITCLLVQLKKLSSLAKKFQISCVIVKTTQPKAFCAGADLGERIKMSTAQVAQTLKAQRNVMDILAAMPCPTIASVQGMAFGGGLELALSCDLRIFSKNALVGLTETRLAIIPGAGGTQRLSRLLGVAKAKELIFRGSKVSSFDAVAMGLANAESENSDALALEWAQEIVAGGPIALVAAKSAIQNGAHKELKQALDVERKFYGLVLKSEDRIEGLKAFTEKRKAIYKGQ